MSEQPFGAELEGMIAGKTSICEITQDRLRYRGYAIEDLADHCCFEEVAHLLIYEALPTSAQLAQFREMLATFRPLPAEVLDALRMIPTNVATTDVLRTAVSMCGHFDPVQGDSPDDLRRRAVWLISVVASITTARSRIARHEMPLEPKAGLSHAAQILYRIQGEVPTERAERLLDLLLILYAEHGYNAGTFTNRVIGSTRSDQVSAVVGAIGALKGTLHGGAAEQVMGMLQQFDGAEQASRWAEEVLAKAEETMGFGHPIYRQNDHRAAILETRMRELADEKRLTRWLDIYDAIKTSMLNRQKPLHPNLDYPCGVAYFLMGLPPALSAPLIVASRVAGWSAHYIEQHARDRIIRPLSRYVGPGEREVVSIERR